MMRRSWAASKNLGGMTSWPRLSNRNIPQTKKHILNAAISDYSPTLDHLRRIAIGSIAVFARRLSQLQEWIVNAMPIQFGVAVETLSRKFHHLSCRHRGAGPAEVGLGGLYQNQKNWRCTWVIWYQRQGWALRPESEGHPPLADNISIFSWKLRRIVVPLWFRRSEPHLPRAASLLETTTQCPPKQLTMAGHHPFPRQKFPARGTPVEREAECRLNQPLPSKIIQANIEMRPASRLQTHGLIRSIVNVVFAHWPVRYRLMNTQHAPSSRVPARTSRVKLPCLWPRHDCMDRPLALILLILAAPLMMAIAFAIIIESPGPVIFRQIRRGLGGKEFLALKFRTMHWEKNSSMGVQTSRLDVRISNVGRILRRASLDEIPQFINVLRGEMSLVGPRPHADGLYDIETERFMLSPEYAERYRVKPGITGWAQIHGLRGAINSVEDMKQRVLYDTHYIKNRSLFLYTVVLTRTPFAIALGRNAF